MARTTPTAGGSWEMLYSFNKGGETGWGMQIPDLLPLFSASELELFASQANVQTGLRDFGMYPQ